MDMHPFANETDTFTLDALIVENRLDRIEMYGNLQITRDKAGLVLALELKALVDATIAILKAGPLPERIDVDPPESSDNPFK